MPAQDHADRLAAALAEGGLRSQEQARAEARRIVIEAWRDLNQWAVDTVRALPGRFVCLAGLDPLLMDAPFIRAEVRDKLGKGTSGLKIAPMFLRSTPDDPRMRIVFEQAREHGVFVLAQAGGHGFRGNPAWGHPKHFAPVLEAFPDVVIQLAHLGLGAEDDVARLTARHPNLYADLSSRMHLFGQPGQWSHEEAAAWVRRIGVGHVLFGTNYPLNDPAQYLQAMQRLPLTPGEKDAILGGNAERILAASKVSRE
jgi:predicted TIM-barrel fold metal-dependent hydrolase